VDIVTGVVPVACAASLWHRQDTNLLVVTNGFCRDAGGVCKLTNRQGSFHNLSSLCDVTGKKGTRSTNWKVKRSRQKNHHRWQQAGISKIGKKPTAAEIFDLLYRAFGMTRQW
jgi:hypothetical protein